VSGLIAIALWADIPRGSARMEGKSRIIFPVIVTGIIVFTVSFW
jgi:hypothetical protein